MKSVCVLISLSWLTVSLAQSGIPDLQSQIFNTAQNYQPQQGRSLEYSNLPTPQEGRMRAPPPLVRENSRTQSDQGQQQAPPAQPDFSDYDEYVPYKGENEDNFDWSLASALMLKTESNFVLSPFSVKLLLALLSEAAGTDTQTQKELGIISPNIRSPFALRSLYERIFNSVKAPSDLYTFQMGTKVYVDNYIEPGQRYAAILEKYYDTQIEQIDFRDSARSTNLINDWCSNITNRHIQKLVQPADVENSAMIMLNAIYFNGLWRRPFAPNETIEQPFYLSSKQEIQTKYMTQTSHFYYLNSEQLNAKILRIPYKGKKFSMLLVLPNSKEGLNELVRQIDGSTFRTAIWLMDKHEVYVVMPKFKFESLTNLNGVLKEMGIREIFTDDASLPLLARGSGLQHQLHVSNVIQKAGIHVDEKGTTVYAATEVSLVNKFGDSTKEFIANRPFLFYIQDETTGTLLFAGKVTNPAEFEIPH